MEFEYTDQLLAALIPLGLTVIFHGLGMDVVRRCYKRFRPHVLNARYIGLRAFFMIGIVAIMLVTHFFGVVIWAGFYFLAGILTSAQDAMLFSMLSYTTIGAPHTLHGHWIGFGGFEAMTGMLMFGWSTAVLAAVVQKIHAIEE
ncbi:MAG: hypothetical protein IPJ48_17080 [Propionivibrio sp.]|uniref:Potassium channel domain-containing protein n=1 Tax=Candidatus Propionivibrio dominans TaxID=2954373 RepID=A0A9D7I9Z2_9RHOO|nr:hypothetical protein [Candidatus Propionivibrio dominans]